MKFFNGSSCDLVKKRLKMLFSEVLTNLIRLDSEVMRFLFVLAMKTDMIEINV